MIFTPIKLDKMRNVVLGFQALQEFKKITGKSLTKIDFESADLDVESIVPAIFYAGLKHEDKELTLEKTNLLEKIDLNIELLTEEDKTNLKNGIRLYGNEALATWKENYTSWFKVLD